jgi:hypothetical protein
MTKRQQLKNLVFDIIDSNRPNSIPQHLLVSGNEGAGKTCLVESLASELLSRGYQVIKFLYPHCNVVTADDIINKVDLSNNNNYIIIDDFDKMLQSLPNDEQYRLRAFLFKKNAPMLIATSTGLYDGFADYRMPFYDAFRVFHIPELEHEDLADILPKKEYEAVKKDEFFLDVMPKLRGNLNYICTLAIALQSCNSVDVAIQSVIAQNDRYFRLLFSGLSGMLQRTLYGLAQAGETASSAEVERLSGLTAANTASGLFRLEKQGIISRVGDKRRNVTYKINDYLLHKWLEKK